LDLTPGTRLGVYEITGPIGEGGMGQVYRATDTTLGRQVAIKILPAVFGGDLDRLSRFEREAKMLASLNHPHIAAIYGFEKSAGLHALVMELVEGEDLSQRIARGPIPLDEALPIAKQIAEALEAAHGQGIIHRDLKPANIKLRSDGTVKVLDFGLAKALEPAYVPGASAGQPEVTHSPTFTSPAMTHAGVILGTAAYMSPEQARGRPVGVQADIWAFGCILLEMLTGGSPFKGPTVTDTLAAIVRAEPDWTSLPADTPPALRSLLGRCLQKDLSRRLHHIGDARIELDETAPGGTAPAASGSRSNRLPWLIALVLAGVAVSLAAALTLKWRSVNEPPELRVDVVTPNSDQLTIALSPDGMKLAYVESVNSASRLQVRSLADGSLKSYAGTDFATNPFWSPDGRSLGFFADGKLKRIDLVSGLTQTIAPAPIGGGGTWNRDGIVIFAPTILGGLFKVPAEGGQPVAVTTRSNKDSGHRSPQFLPDGRRFIYFAGGDAGVRGLYLAALDGSSPAKRVVEADGVATLMGSDRVLFARQGVLFAQHLDADRGELTGAPVAIANNVAFDPTTYVAAVTATPGGALAYRSGAATGQRQLAWFDRAGRKTDRLGDADPSGLFNPDISPDGRFVAVNRAVDNEDVWLIDTTRGTRRRFTFDPGNDQVPVWSADGQHIVFSSNRGGDSYDLYEKPAERPGAEQLLFASKENKFPMGVSRDGRYLLYRNTAPNTDWDLWALPLLGEKKPFPVVKSAFQEMIGEFSPDGGWVAYQTNESGQHEVYVQSFPDPTTRTQISTAGGSQPRWRRDGKELFFVALDGRLMAAPLTLNANHLLEAGAPVPLFMTHMPGGAVPSPQKQQYAVSPDGQRFLINTVLDDAVSSAVSLILNWRPPDAR